MKTLCSVAPLSKLVWKDINKEKPKDNQRILAILNRKVFELFQLPKDYQSFNYSEYINEYYRINKWIPIEEFEEMFEGEE